MYTGTLSKSVPDLSFFVISEQKSDSFIANAAVTNFILLVGCAVSSCSSTLKVIEAFGKLTIYEDVDLPLLGLLLKFASENSVSLNSPCL